MNPDDLYKPLPMCCRRTPNGDALDDAHRMKDSPIPLRRGYLGKANSAREFRFDVIKWIICLSSGGSLFVIRKAEISPTKSTPR